ncbi:hypothetical protein L345_05357, partial [Ophiophagus hannah]
MMILWCQNLYSAGQPWKKKNILELTLAQLSLAARPARGGVHVNGRHTHICIAQFVQGKGASTQGSIRVNGASCASLNSRQKRLLLAQVELRV